MCFHRHLVVGAVEAPELVIEAALVSDVQHGSSHCQVLHSSTMERAKLAPRATHIRHNNVRDFFGIIGGDRA